MPERRKSDVMRDMMCKMKVMMTVSETVRLRKEPAAGFPREDRG